jgi:branched-chain amino acid transport system ATP-binding protein
LNLLEIRGLNKDFGALRALKDVSLSIERNQIKGLIGPNGSGKTTLFNLITKFHSPTSGEVFFKGNRIDFLEAYEIASLGICRTFQIVKVFQEISVLENVMAGMYCRTKSGLFRNAFALPSARREFRESREKAEGYLEIVGLHEWREKLVKYLTCGQQKLLEIARALATEPELLLLDEPAAGLNSHEKEELSGIIRNIRDRGITILLIEHDMRLIMGIAGEIAVLNFGEKIAEGVPEEIKGDEKVVKAYLGKG